MDTPQFNDLFPGIDVATISQQQFVDRLKLLNLPTYLERHRFAQFCLQRHERPNWSLFPPPRTGPRTI